MGGPKSRNSTSLQALCCKFITLHTEKFPASFFEELNQPCLNTLVEQFSMYDLLNYEKFLETRGVDAKAAMYRCQRRLFDCIEAYPIKATTCPHLLQNFPCDGLEWGLSRMLYRRVIIHLMDEVAGFPTDLLNLIPLYIKGNNVLHLQSHLLDLFCPANCTDEERDKIKEKVLQTKEIMINMINLSARKVVFMTVDMKVCHFLLKDFEAILKPLCESVQVLSFLLKSFKKLITLIRYFKKHGEKLERISLYVIRMQDLMYFDEILSVCSGVSMSGVAMKARLDLQNAITAETSYESELSALEDVDSRPIDNLLLDADDGSRLESDSQPTFDLMDDALLFATPHHSSKFDSMAGLSKADLKFTNLVKQELYVPVLNHHLKSWLALQELHLGIPELEPDVTEGICSLLQRPQFKVFTLSSADYHPIELEEILVAVAKFRKYNPLEKLMFVSLQEIALDMRRILINDCLSGKSPEEVVEYLKPLESEKLAELRGFQGTKLFEMYQCQTGVKTEALVRQFVLKDEAIASLCLRDSMSRQALESLLKFLALENRQLVSLLLEDWHVLSTTSCDALVSLLQSSSDSMNYLSLKGCLTDHTEYDIRDVIDATAGCQHLKSIDFSENMLGEHIISFIKSVVSQTQVTEISLRKGNMPKKMVVNLLEEMAAITRTRRYGLETLDLRGNQFYEADKEIHVNVIEDIARHVLVSISSDTR